MSYTLVLLNYAGLQQKMFTKLYLPFLELTFRSVPIKKFHNAVFVVVPLGTTPSVALLFLSPLFSFQGASRDIPSKLNNVRLEIVLRFLRELSVALRAPL